MTLAELDALLDDCERTATALLARDGGHAPMALAVAPNGASLPIAFTRFDEAAKARLRGLFEAMASRGATAFVLITEAWAAVGSDAAQQAAAWRAMGRSLASFAERQEILVLSGACPTGQRVRVRPILRAPNGVRLGAPLPLPEGGTLSSRFFDELPWADPAVPDDPIPQEES